MEPGRRVPQGVAGLQKLLRRGNAPAVDGDGGQGLRKAVYHCPVIAGQIRHPQAAQEADHLVRELDVRPVSSGHRRRGFGCNPHNHGRVQAAHFSGADQAPRSGGEVSGGIPRYRWRLDNAARQHLARNQCRERRAQRPHQCAILVPGSEAVSVL